MFNSRKKGKINWEIPQQYLLKTLHFNIEEFQYSQLQLELNKPHKMFAGYSEYISPFL